MQWYHNTCLTAASRSMLQSSAVCAEMQHSAPNQLAPDPKALGPRSCSTVLESPPCQNQQRVDQAKKQANITVIASSPLTSRFSPCSVTPCCTTQTCPLRDSFVACTAEITIPTLLPQVIWDRGVASAAVGVTLLCFASSFSLVPPSPCHFSPPV